MSKEKAKPDRRRVKCPYCEEWLERGNSIRHKNGRYFHPECFEKNRDESNHYKELISYVCELYGLDRPTGQILRQIKIYKEDPELNYTYKGMELTLRYFYEILGNKPREGDGVGIIPHQYHNATQQYIKQMKINDSIDNIKNSKKTVVYVSPKKQSRKKNLIDMDSL